MEKSLLISITMNMDLPSLVSYEDGKDVCYWYIFNNDLTIDAGIKNVIEHIDEIIVVFNEMGILQKMNSICDQILPFKRKDVLKKSIDELVKDGKVSNPVITEMIEKKKKN